VTFRNPTSLEHTVVRCTPDQCDGNSGGTGANSDFTGTHDLPPDSSFELTFAQPGTSVYFCSLHGYTLMRGTITVIAAEPATTFAASTLPPTVAPTIVDDPNGLANTGGAPVPLLGIAGAFLVVGLAATGLAARRRTEQHR
jgi:LPXTG-motif cell wall-anchored protein